MGDILDKKKQEILKEMSPDNLFLFGMHTPEFRQRFIDAYESLRRERIDLANMLIADRSSMNARDYDKIQKYRDMLEDEEFFICELLLKQHNDNEVFIKAETNVRHRNIDVVHFFEDPNRDMVALLSICDMLNRSGASQIRLVTPYLPYMREDKKDEGKVPITARMVFDLFHTVCNGKLERIVTADLHAEQEQGFSPDAVEHISAINTFARYLSSDYLMRRLGETKPISTMLTVVSPDIGGVKRAKRLSKLIGCGLYIFDKSRPYHGEAEINESVGDINTPYAVLVDDLISTAGSMGNAAKSIRQRYKNLKIVLGLGTHGEFCAKKDNNGKIIYRAEDVLRESGMKIVVTDSIPKSFEWYKENSDWLYDVISMAWPLANMTLTNRINFSVSGLLHRLDEEVINAVKDHSPMSIDRYLVKGIDD